VITSSNTLRAQFGSRYLASMRTNAEEFAGASGVCGARSVSTVKHESTMAWSRICPPLGYRQRENDPGRALASRGLTGVSGAMGGRPEKA
jgi:hypothetical protein